MGNSSCQLLLFPLNSECYATYAKYATLYTRAKRHDTTLRILAPHSRNTSGARSCAKSIPFFFFFFRCPFLSPPPNTPSQGIS